MSGLIKLERVSFSKLCVLNTKYLHQLVFDKKEDNGERTENIKCINGKVSLSGSV